MSIIFFDTETTGLTPGQICQLAYIKMSAGGETAGVNYFFAVEHMPAAAAEIHGLTKERLAVLSGGKVFKDSAEQIRGEFAAADLLVAHNFPFDQQFMSAEFARAGKIFRYNKSFCTMRKLTPVLKLLRSDGRSFKYPRLDEVASIFKLHDDANTFANMFFDETADFHDARYDSTLVYLAFLKMAAADPEAAAYLAGITAAG